MRGRAAAIALAVASIVRAQEPDPHDAQPERPTVATHAYTVAPGWSEIEFGLELDHAASTRVFSTPATWKVGLAKRLQIEATTYFVSQSDSGIDAGLGDLTLALKWRVADTLPLLGDFAIQPSVELPTGSAGTGNGQTVGEFLLISSNHFGPVEMDINAGFFERLNDRSTAPPTSTLWTVSAGSAVRGALGWTMEVYGYPGTHGAAGSAPIVALLTGPTYVVHPWFVADAGLILPLDGPQPHAVYMGLTWNMGQLWIAGRATVPSH